jgi:hypothetical protein
MHYTIWQKAIAKAYRLDPWLGDFLVWTAWHRSLQANREQMFIDEMTEAKAALSAMRPAIDREKLADIKRAYDAWRAADTRCGLLADPEDEGSPSERQEAAEEAAWAWDQAAAKFMWNADTLLAMIGGPNAE